jgi:hypothetical protein
MEGEREISAVRDVRCEAENIILPLNSDKIFFWPQGYRLESTHTYVLLSETTLFCKSQILGLLLLISPDA